MIARSQVVDAASRWLGTPFRHQASAIGVGIDCLQLVIAVGKAVGAEGASSWLKESEVSSYGKSPRPDVLLSACDRFLDRIQVEAAGLGDVLVMAFNVFPQHFAIVSRVAPMYVIHAYPLGAVNKCVENGVAVAGARTVRAYRYRGMEP